MKTVHPSPLLTFALRIDALLSGTAAALQVAAAPTLATLTGLPQPLLWGSGVFMLAYAMSLWWMSSRARLPSWAVWLIAVGNLTWAVACLLLPTATALAPTALGWGWLLVHATSVTAFAILQALGLQRSAASFGPGSPRRSPSTGSVS